MILRKSWHGELFDLLRRMFDIKHVTNIRQSHNFTVLIWHVPAITIFSAKIKMPIYIKKSDMSVLFWNIYRGGKIVDDMFQEAEQ